MVFLAHQLVDVVVEITDLIIRQTHWELCISMTPSHHLVYALPSWILEIFLEISLRMSLRHFSASCTVFTTPAKPGLRVRILPPPSSAAWASRKRYSIDCAFSSLRACQMQWLIGTVWVFSWQQIPFCIDCAMFWWWRVPNGTRQSKILYNREWLYCFWINDQHPNAMDAWQTSPVTFRHCTNSDYLMKRWFSVSRDMWACIDAFIWIAFSSNGVEKVASYFLNRTWFEQQPNIPAAKHSRIEQKKQSQRMSVEFASSFFFCPIPEPCLDFLAHLPACQRHVSLQDSMLLAHWHLALPTV